MAREDSTIRSLAEMTWVWGTFGRDEKLFAVLVDMPRRKTQCSWKEIY